MLGVLRDAGRLFPDWTLALAPGDAVERRWVRIEGPATPYGGYSRRFYFRAAAPLIAAAVLLGMLGTAGQRTDVGAHVSGLLAGVTVGAALRAAYGMHLPRPIGQMILVLATGAAVIAAWTLALLG